MDDLLNQLRDTPCDREPFTPAHAYCQCRVANAAADEIERLRKIETADLILHNLDVSASERAMEIMQRANMRPSHRQHYADHIAQGIREAMQDAVAIYKAKQQVETD
jgi:hypothetical protein